MINQTYDKKTGATWLQNDAGYKVVIYKFGKSWNCRLGGIGHQITVTPTKKQAVARAIQFLEIERNS
jgi:hypothetical protein